MQHRQSITVPNPDVWQQNIHRYNTVAEIKKRRLEAEAIREYGEVEYELPKGLYPQKEKVSWWEIVSNIDWSKIYSFIREDYQKMWSYIKP